MEPGDLDRRVTIEQRNVARDTSFGNEVVTWASIATAPTVWANVVDVPTPKKGGDEEVRGGERVLARRSIVTIRYRSDLTTSMRINEPARSRVLQITGMAEIGRRDWLELTCEQYSA